MSIFCYQLHQIPDLSLIKYQSLSDSGVEGVLKRHEIFLRQWHGICKEAGTSFHLLYCFQPELDLGHRLSVYFIIQGEIQRIKMVEPILRTSPLNEFFQFEHCQLPFIQLAAGCTAIKKERLANIFNPILQKSMQVHYVPEWEMNEDARLYDLFKIMETVSLSYSPNRPCIFRVDLYPAEDAKATRDIIQPFVKDLRGENNIVLLKENDTLRSDSYVREICQKYEDWLTHIETSPHFHCNIYAFAENSFLSRIILNAVCSEALKKGEFSVADLRPDSDGCFNILSRMGEKAEEYTFYHADAVLKNWCTTFCLPEIVPFFRFPALYEGESIEIPKETDPVSIEGGIHIGTDRNGHPVNFDLKDLPKHAFFTGTPGSGKTNTMLHLVTELHKKGIPFLALEPAKKEYRALLGFKEMQDIHLFSPHLQSKFPLQVNPLEFPCGVRLSEHIKALLDVFSSSFLLEGPTFKYLSTSIERAYRECGWDIEEVNTEDNGLDYPTLQDVYDFLEEEINLSTYDGDLKGNIQSFLQVRLGSLMERDAGEMYDVNISTINPGKWISISAIVELEVLPEQVKNFFVLLICHYITETLIADPNGGVDAFGVPMPVRHVVFIEEAHNIIASSKEQSSSESVDPKVAATSYITNMLAELRARREAIVIADQLPTALASEVTKNTGLKLVHRLISQDDRQQIGNAISATPVQLERMASINCGRAFIYHEKILKPFEVQVDKWEEPEITFDCSDDAQLYNEMWTLPTVCNATSTAFYNFLSKYFFHLQNYYFDIHASRKAAKNFDELRSLAPSFLSLKNALITVMKKIDRLEKLWILSPDVDIPLIETFQEIKSMVEDMVDSVG